MPIAAARSAAVCAAGAAARRNEHGGGSFGAAGSNVRKGSLTDVSAAPPKKQKRRQSEIEAARTPANRMLHKVLDFLDQTWLQTLQYIVFLVAFQSLTGTIRMREEFYFDK